MVPAMALVGVGGNRRRRRILGFLALCTLFTLALFIPACSSSKTTTPPAGTPAGNYTITITAAAGSDTKTQTVGLTVP
jgi:predicted component of type VI protein secretion system